MPNVPINSLRVGDKFEVDGRTAVVRFITLVRGVNIEVTYGYTERISRVGEKKLTKPKNALVTKI